MIKIIGIEFRREEFVFIPVGKPPGFIIRSFWESRTLFSKRVLAAGGKK